VGQFIVEHAQYTPDQGWLEHDPWEIVNNVQHAMNQTVERVKEFKPDF
jgi:glycerol kinase